MVPGLLLKEEQCAGWKETSENKAAFCFPDSLQLPNNRQKEQQRALRYSAANILMDYLCFCLAVSEKLHVQKYFN